MGTFSAAQKWIGVHGPTLDRYRSFVPRELLAYWICAETGGDRLACSTDPRLVELGWPQAPIVRARNMDVDPFHVFGGLWCACREALDDAAHWRGTESSDLQRRKIGAWLKRADSNLWWVIQMDYSVGTGALKRILSQTVAWAEGKGRGPEDRGLMIEAIDWANTTDLAAHRAYWGRQSPEKILMRIEKHRDWIREAQRLGNLDDAPPGEEPSERRPEFAPGFPEEIVRNAKIAEDRDSNTEKLKASLAEVRLYLRRRRRAEFRIGKIATEKAALTKRISDGLGKIVGATKTFLGAEPELPVLVERDGATPRAVIPW